MTWTYNLSELPVANGGKAHAGVEGHMEMGISVLHLAHGVGRFGENC